MRDPHGGGSCLGDGKGEVYILCRCLGLEEGSSEGLLGWDSYLHGEHMEGGFLRWENVGAEVSCALQGASHFWKARCRESCSAPRQLCSQGKTGAMENLDGIDGERSAS
jgi:hypothetical protein